MEKSELSVGMPVKVTAYSRQYEGTVTKIGLKLVTINYGVGYMSDAQFRISSQQLNDRNYGSNTYFRTIPQLEEEVRRSEVMQQLKDGGLEPRWGHRDTKLSTETLEKVVAILKEDATNVVQQEQDPGQDR